MSKLHYLAATSGLLLAAVAGAAQAEGFQPKAKGTWMVNVRVTDVVPSVKGHIDLVAPISVPDVAEADSKSNIVPSLGLTYFATDNWALETIFGGSRHPIKASGLTVARTWQSPAVVMLQYHPMPAARFSPYVGAGPSYVLYYKIKNSPGYDAKIDDGFGFAIQAGADIATMGPYSVNLDVKKVFFSTDVNASTGATQLHSKAKIDPLGASVGVGYKF